MIGKKTSISMMLLAGVGSSSMAAAQMSNPGVFAMSLQDSLVRIDTQSVDLNGQQGSIVLLMNGANQDQQSLFRDLDPQNGEDFANRGRDLNAIDAGRFVQPKEDNLNVVPLPSAAFAGFGLLIGAAGVRQYLKSRR